MLRKSSSMFNVAFNECSKKAFSQIPPILQGFILEVQEGLEKSVLRRYSGASAVSGYRCSCENRRCGGVAHSLHLVGMARDFKGIPDGVTFDIPGVRVIPEPKKGIYHFEVA